jgi:hypothetical protein
MKNSYTNLTVSHLVSSDNEIFNLVKIIEKIRIIAFEYKEQNSRLQFHY